MSLEKGQPLTKIGYMRVSTKHQSLERQRIALEKAGCVKIFQDEQSGKDTKRPGLHELMQYVRQGDEIVVQSLDRLGRNTKDNKELMQYFNDKGVAINILNIPSFQALDNPALRNLMTGLMVDIFSYIAESERKTMLERQRQGIELAKQNGKFKGRKPKFTNENKQVKKAVELYKSDKSMTMQDIADFCNMSRSTLYRSFRKLGLK